MATDTAHTGWAPDPLGRHEERYLILGEPTDLVRDGGVEDADPADAAPVAPPAVAPAGPPAVAPPAPQATPEPLVAPEPVMAPEPPPPTWPEEPAVSAPVVEPPEAWGVAPVTTPPTAPIVAPEPAGPPVGPAAWTPGDAGTQEGGAVGPAGWESTGPAPAPEPRPAEPEAEVEVRLDGWPLGERSELARALVEQNVPFTWLGTVVVVDRRDLPTVERLRAIVRPFDAGTPPHGAPDSQPPWPRG